MLPYFAVTLFVSASLLFLVQPMVGKMILPRLGGTPAVWNTCMVFFQAVLLVGYGYTHSLSTWCTRRWQLIMQMAILLMPLAFMVLPFSMGAWSPPDDSNPIFSVLWLLLGMVGLPFFVVATSAPLLQKWFADTGHPAGKDPYFLYGASNLGSMLALLLYPLAVEPMFAVEQQAVVWTVGYIVLAVLVGGCMMLVSRSPSMHWQMAAVAIPTTEAPPVAEAPVPAPKTAVQPARRQGRRGLASRSAPTAGPTPAEPLPVSLPSRPVTMGRRLRWLGLAAAPSSLMLGVTTHLTTDVAAIPFFWVIPLALYLLTFILVFSRWPVVWTERPHTFVLYAQPFLLTVVVMFLAHGTVFRWVWAVFLLHVLVFFFTTLVCHGELAKDRPGTAHLTEFYLWMSLGGVLGGIFNALIAPLIFWTGPHEYALAMICSYLLRPNLIGTYVLIPGDTDAYETTLLGRVLDFVVPLLMAIWTLLVFITIQRYPWFSRGSNFGIGPISFELSLADLFKIVTAALIVGMFSRPVRFALSLGAFALVSLMFQRHERPFLLEDRDFFGFVRVRTTWIGEEDGAPRPADDNETYRALIHGDIDHGWQSFDKARRREPLTYFHPVGGIGQVFEKFSWFGGKSQSFAWPDYRIPAALAGLGAGMGPGVSPFDLAWTMAIQGQSEPAYGCIGLGIGTLGAHAKPYQYMRFYEIQPAVKRLSLPGEGKKPIFYFLQDAIDRGSDMDVILGDGRLTLEKHRVERYYHIFVIDAFSSDAIPIHLLTREAIEVYLSKLADGGLLVFNTTNRYVDLRGPLRDVADSLDLTCYHYGAFNRADIPLLAGSDWVVMQRKNVDFNGTQDKTMSLKDARQYRLYNGGAEMPDYVLPAPVREPAWNVPAGLGGPIWTDRYSNLLRVMSWR